MRLTAEFIRHGEFYIGCTVSGHASSRDGRGEILCASVSSAVELTCNTLTELLHASVQLEVSPQEGRENRISFRLQKPDKTQSLLIAGLLLHLQNLSEDYRGMMTVNVTEDSK